MEIFTEIDLFRKYLWHHKLNKKTVGLVPTMGALHDGHAALISASALENDITVCSIFVNPTQFNNQDDLQKYPKDIEGDTAFLKKIGCDAVFCPEVNTMYPLESQIALDFGYLSEIMEGKFRPGHFSGVGMVVSKLLNIVHPDRAYFGQKDLQQFVVVDHLVKSLNFDVTLRCVPIVREADGLAQSSRNKRLSESGRKEAIIFYNALTEAKQLLSQGKSVEDTKSAIKNIFDNQDKVELEYFEVVNKESLKSIHKFVGEEEVALCIAGFVGDVRLIDNMIIE